MKVITGTYMGRRKQTPRDSNSTSRLHRWMIARHETGWRDSLQRDSKDDDVSVIVLPNIIF
jgi:hypothetical protein